jgi:hypothetical protein
MSSKPWSAKYDEKLGTLVETNPEITSSDVKQLEAFKEFDIKKIDKYLEREKNQDPNASGASK